MVALCPLSHFHHYIEINITDNCHFALVYLSGTTRLRFTRSTGQEPTIYVQDHHMKVFFISISVNILMILSRFYSHHSFGYHMKVQNRLNSTRYAREDKVSDVDMKLIVSKIVMQYCSKNSWARQNNNEVVF